MEMDLWCEFDLICKMSFKPGLHSESLSNNKQTNKQKFKEEGADFPDHWILHQQAWLENIQKEMICTEYIETFYIIITLYSI